MQVPVNDIEKWELVLSSIEKDTIPLDCVKKVLIKLKGSKQKTINLKKLRDSGLEFEEIEIVVTRAMYDFQDDIVNIDFVIDVQSVAAYIQPLTDKILEKL